MVHNSLSERSMCICKGLTSKTHCINMNTIGQGITTNLHFPVTAKKTIQMTVFSKIIIISKQVWVVHLLGKGQCLWSGKGQCLWSAKGQCLWSGKGQCLWSIPLMSTYIWEIFFHLVVRTVVTRRSTPPETVLTQLVVMATLTSIPETHEWISMATITLYRMEYWRYEINTRYIIVPMLFCQLPYLSVIAVFQYVSLWL